MNLKVIAKPHREIENPSAEDISTAIRQAYAEEVYAVILVSDEKRNQFIQLPCGGYHVEYCVSPKGPIYAAENISLELAIRLFLAYAKAEDIWKTEAPWKVYIDELESSERHRHPTVKLRIALILVAVLAVVGGFWFTQYNRYETSEYKEYLEVCAGRGVDSAAAYINGQTTHPILIADKGIFGYRRKSPHNNGLPADWRPESVSDIQLVLCIDRTRREMIESCIYHDPVRVPPHVARYQYVSSMRLVNARTGITLQAIELYGDAPERCPASMPTHDMEIVGSPVSADAIIQWLSQYFEP